MARAYTEELNERMQEIDTCKARMEKWYAGRLEDDQVVGNQKDEYDATMALAETTIASTNKSLKLIKNALVPHQPKRFDNIFDHICFSLTAIGQRLCLFGMNNLRCQASFSWAELLLFSNEVR